MWRYWCRCCSLSSVSTQVPLIHSISSVLVGQCSEEAQRLLCSGPVRDENNSPVASSSSRSSSSCRRFRSRSSSSHPSSSWEGTPTSSAAASKVEIKAATSTSISTESPSFSSPAPNPSWWDQSQERLQQPVVAGPSVPGYSHSPSAPSQGRNLLPKESQYPPKKRIPRILLLPGGAHPDGSASRAPAAL
ncbi:hypothetical protein DUI87_00561 [Hirundo rustica rustica]|uniref:Uncharacterized protein n=1 Tax=Hirundo rustica rustica TaxID=333673 RepID=A0A3M0LH30_HIRRU|nr:hypothetical protein DUI87_00561 [Hirundo rustica rustica]